MGEPSIAQIAEGLTPTERQALEEVCRSNGGGVRVKCRTGDDGYGIPTAPAFRKLLGKGLIQGKSGGYETVVHTRDGLAVRAHLRSRDDAK